MAVQVLSWGVVEPGRDLPNLISCFTEQVGPPPAVAACVALPARDEAATLPTALRALAAQVDAGGLPLESPGYEVVVLLNNCSDGSKDAALSAASPRLSMTVVDLELPPACAHVGWARRIAMDLADARLRAAGGQGVILTTDADSEVAQDWVAANLAEVARGADVVGGDILIRERDLARLPAEARRCVALDRRYRCLVRALRRRLQLGPGDAFSRLDQHSGASLAITRAMYRRIGRLPPRPSGEDILCVARARAAAGRVRRSSEVRVWTSCRLTGRVRVGMAGTLRRWSVHGADAILVPGIDDLLARGAHASEDVPVARVPIRCAIAQLERFLGLDQERRRIERLPSAAALAFQ